MEVKTVEVFFEMKEHYIDSNFTKEDTLKNGEWNSVIVPENRLILLARILSKNDSFWYMIRLDEKTSDKVKIYKVSKKKEKRKEKRNDVFKDFKGHYAKKDGCDERLFHIDFFDEKTNKRIFKGTIKIGKKTRQGTILCNAFIVKQTPD